MTRSRTKTDIKYADALVEMARLEREMDEQAARNLDEEWHRKTADPDIKRSITIRIDPDILDFFKKDGSRWQTRMNDALREWMIARTSSQNENM